MSDAPVSESNNSSSISRVDSNVSLALSDSAVESKDESDVSAAPATESDPMLDASRSLEATRLQQLASSLGSSLKRVGEGEEDEVEPDDADAKDDNEAKMPMPRFEKQIKQRGSAILIINDREGRFEFMISTRAGADEIESVVGEKDVKRAQ